MVKSKKTINPRCVAGANVHARSAAIFTKDANGLKFGVPAKTTLLNGVVEGVIKENRRK